MSSRNLKTYEQRTQKSSKSLLCLMCALCVGFAGCESDSVPTTVKLRQEDVTQPTEDLPSVDLCPEQIEQPNAAYPNLVGKSSPTASTAIARSEAPKNNREDLGYGPKIVTDLKANAPPLAKTQVDSPAEILAKGKVPVTTSQPLCSEMCPQHINIPILNEPGMADELVAVNFDQVDIHTVLKTIGDITGINFVVDESVRGPVTLMSPTKMRLGDLYSVLESILEVEGYAAVPTETLVKIFPRAEATKRNLQVRFGSDPAEIPKSDTIVTQIIPLSYADAAEVSQIIQPFLAAGSQMSTYPRTNSIVITDTSSNIHHIAKIIQKLDVPGSKEQVAVFGLKYASSQVLSEQITGIMQKTKGTSPQTGRSRTTPRVETDIKILPDVRTNSLIVVANTQDIETIEGLIKQLDIQRPIGTNNVHVVYLKNAQAKELAESLTAALTNLKIAGALEATQHVQVSADEGTNALIITASAQDYEVIAEIIQKLDIVREQVLVEMLIMEVSEDALEEIGIDWETFDQPVEDSVRFFGQTNFGPRVDFLAGNLEGLAVGAWKGTGSNLRIGAVLHALQKESGVNILSTPHITTSNHHKANIVVGKNKAFVMQSRITEADPLTPTKIETYEYKDVGITLEITPHISQGGLVRLEIDSEFTKLIEDVTAPSLYTPTTAKRQAQTVVSMNSGSTVVIGGLIRDDKVTIEKKIPLVGDVPLVGDLFKFRREQLQKTNLLMFITPHVIGSQQDLEQITEKKRKEMMPAPEDFQQQNGQD